MKSNSYFIDANVFLRYLTQDDPKLSRKATAIFEQIARKKINAYINTLTLHEVIYVLKYVYNVKKDLITRNIQKLITLSNLFVIDIDKKALSDALFDYKNKNIDFPDCVYAHIASTNNMRIVSFDQDFRKLHRKVISDLNE